MSLDWEDILIIAETVQESYRLHRRRVGPELAGEIADDLLDELIRKYDEDNGKAHTQKQNDIGVDPGNAGELGTDSGL